MFLCNLRFSCVTASSTTLKINTSTGDDLLKRIVNTASNKMKKAGSSSGKPDDASLSEEEWARFREWVKRRVERIRLIGEELGIKLTPDEFARKLTPDERSLLEGGERIRQREEELGRKLTLDERIRLLGEELGMKLTLAERIRLIREDRHRVVPEEIIARGPEALQAYNDALKSGKTKNQRVLVTVVGPARAGKTSLLRSLKGEKFNPNQDSTIGTHLQASFCKPQENSWCEDQTGKHHLHTSSLVKIIAKNLHTRTREEHLAEASYSSTPLNLKDERDSRHKDSEGLEQESEEELLLENETVQKIDLYDKISKMPEELVDSLLNYLKSAKNDDRADENSIYLKTLDFAGQQVYEVLLPLFMSSKSIYILVYNLENDLDKCAQFKVEHGKSERAERELENHFEMTNLETLEFWLSCISSYTKKGGESVGDRIPVALPPVFVACTHADKCKEDPKRLRVAETLVRDLTRPENPCGKHIMQNVYTVDNTLSGHKEIKDKSAKRLKADIEELSKYLPQMNEYIPLNWLKFEEKLSNLVENEQKRYIEIEEARRIAKKCNINTATESNEFATLLNYLHDLKSIIYFEETSTVFIDIQWLISMLVGVITVLPFEEWKDYADYWRKLEDEGVLQRALVEHVWKDIADDGQNTVDSLILIMEKFSLICRWRLNDEEVFLVPCMLCNSKRSKVIERFLAGPKCSTMVIHFKSVHLPLGIFPRLVVAVAEHGKKEWPKVKQPKFRPNFFRMYNVGDEVRFDICISSGIRTICIAVFNNDNIDSQLVTHFCQFVRKLLAQIFDDMRRNLPWMENMEFEYGIGCPVCPSSEEKCNSHKMEGCTRDSCLHFVSEKELKDGRPRCYRDETKSDNVIKEEAYAHWFPKKSKKPAATASEEPDRSGTSGGPSGSVKLTPSFNLSDNQKRWIVVGIGLNKTLLPNLRDFLAPEMSKHYADLKTKHKIDKQNLSRRLKKDGRYSLNYSSINNNEGKEETNFDFAVKSEVDLGKLYLRPYMAKVTGFDDTCDLSAVLGILSSASVFSSKTQDLASKVRKHVRNEWGHCNFLAWDEAKFTSSLQLMDSLIRELKLPYDKEKRITDELKDWEARGMNLNIIDDDGLLEFVQYGEGEIKRLSQEVKRLGRSQEEGTKQITKALLSIREAFDKDKEEIYKTVEANKREIDANKREIEEIKMNNKERLKRVEALEETMETLKVNTVKPAEQEAASPGPPGVSGDVAVVADNSKKRTPAPEGNAVCQELVSIIGVQDLLTIDATTAADKVADYLQLNKSSMADPPDDVTQKCRAFCLQLKKLGRCDIIKELRKTLPSGMTGPLLDDNTLYRDLDFTTRRDLTRALCGKDLWKWLASVLGVPGEHLGYYGIQTNPAEAVLEDETKKKLTIGELYDKLVFCKTADLADKYL